MSPITPRLVRRLVRQAALFTAALAAYCLMAPARPALADGMSSSLPPAPPRQTAPEDDDPRRPFRMGTADDNMHMGYDEDGNMVMEVRPQAPPATQTPNMGPIYVYPQVYGGEGMMNQVNPGLPGSPGSSGSPGQPMNPMAPMNPMTPGGSNAPASPIVK